MRRTRITYGLLIFLIALLGASLACNLTGPAPDDTPTAATIPPTITDTPTPAITHTPTPTSGPTVVVAPIPSGATYTSTPLTPTISPVPLVSFSGQVCPTCAV